MLATLHINIHIIFRVFGAQKVRQDIPEAVKRKQKNPKENEKIRIYHRILINKH